MKELSIEEKAKRYDEALERARDVYTYYCDDREQLRKIESIFPELAESEDERIKHEIKVVLANTDLSQFALEYTFADMLAWLEKQGEKLPVGFYYVNSEGKKFYSDTFKYGNVILHVEKQGEQKSAEFKPLFRVGDVIKPKDPVLGEPRIIKGIHPKFGYDTNNGILDFEFEDNWELVEQNHAWSEEDSPYYDDICEMLINLLHSETADVNKGAVQKDLDWLMSLRPQNKWKPSDEQIKAIKWVMDGDNPENWSVVLKNLYQDLKKLKG